MQLVPLMSMDPRVQMTQARQGPWWRRQPRLQLAQLGLAPRLDLDLVGADVAQKTAEACPMIACQGFSQEQVRGQIIQWRRRPCWRPRASTVTTTSRCQYRCSAMFQSAGCPPDRDGDAAGDAAWLSARPAACLACEQRGLRPELRQDIRSEALHVREVTMRLGIRHEVRHEHRCEQQL